MKAILQSEFAFANTFAPATAGLLLLVCVILCWSTGSTAITCSICAMMPMLLAMTCANADESNGWSRYRAALPYSRCDIIAGRYLAITIMTAVTVAASIVIAVVLDALVGPLVPNFEHTAASDIITSCMVAAAIGLIISAIVQPFLVKFGNSKGMRYVMLALFLGTFVIVGFVQGQLDERTLALAAQWLDINFATALAATIAATFVALAASCAISLRIYQRKDL